MLSNTLISGIRTGTPIVIGAALSFLALHFGVVVNNQTEAALAVPLTAVLIGGYWAAARMLEHKWPRLGVLLGVPGAPNYRKAQSAKKAVKRA